MLFAVLTRYVGDGVLDIPSAVRRQFGLRKNMPIEVIFLRRVVEDADPYSYNVERICSSP